MFSPIVVGGRGVLSDQSNAHPLCEAGDLYRASFAVPPLRISTIFRPRSLIKWVGIKTAFWSRFLPGNPLQITSTKAFPCSVYLQFICERLTRISFSSFHSYNSRVVWQTGRSGSCRTLLRTTVASWSGNLGEKENLPSSPFSCEHCSLLDSNNERILVKCLFCDGLPERMTIRPILELNLVGFFHTQIVFAVSVRVQLKYRSSCQSLHCFTPKADEWIRANESWIHHIKGISPQSFHGPAIGHAYFICTISPPPTLSMKERYRWALHNLDLSRRRLFMHSKYSLATTYQASRCTRRYQSKFATFFLQSVCCRRH